MDFGDKILEYRKKAGLSQEELGYKLNVTRQSVSLWENNQAQPSLENLIALAKIFNVSISELCGENEEIDKKSNDVVDEALFKASVNYTEQIYVNVYKSLYFKHIIINCCAILLSIFILVGILVSDTNNGVAIIPVLCIFVFVSYILRVFSNIKKLSKDAAKLKPNLKVEYSFFDKYFVMNSKSDNSNSTYNKKYSEIQTKTQDSEYIYLTFDGVFTVIDKKTCEGHSDRLIELIGLKREDNSIKKKIKVLLLISFIVSLISIYIALMVVAISVNSSPLPDFPLVMAEYMWKFFIIVPIPLASIILGFIYLKKGYKCKKNIIAGIIMTGLLCVFGSFTGFFSDRVSHDMSYLDPISEKINLDIPTDGYISIMYDFQDSGDSLAMVKIDDQNDSFASKLDNNNNWKKDTSFIPSNEIDLYLLTMTSSYDYFMVYNLTTNSYNYFEGKTIYFAYNIESDVLLIYCSK